MSITELSIKRPTLIIVLFIVLTALGLISYSNLRYELLPKIDPPAVTVIAVYPGAAPSEVETSVTKVIEDAVSTVDKIKRISAQSGEGVATVAIEFQMNADANLALQDVQRKVNEVISALPAGVKSPEVVKYSLSDLPVLRVGITSLLPPQDLSELLKEQVKPRLSQVAGAGQITFVGMDERELQVSLRAASLEAYGLSILQVLDALKAANRDVPAGKLKESTRDVSLRVTGKFKSIADVQNAVVATINNGAASGGIVRLSDVADVFEGGKDQTTLTRLNGKSAVALLIQKQSDANAVSVSESVRAEMKILESEFADSGLKFDIAQDASLFTLAAADAVNHDLVLAIVFVALVMLVFLHSLRDPLIVMVAIPTSLVTTFIFMYLLGFSLNLMTLLAMSLAIGILVDDAMVVHENIARHLAMGKDKVQAALDGRNEIGFSALSITLVDVVVFLPISFVSGLIGNILREFALVMVVSTLTSLFVSFTLTPMLASRFIKHEHLDKKTWFGKFGLWFEHRFETFTTFYAQALKWAFSHRWVVATAAVLLLAGSLALAAFGVIGAEFISSTDRSQLAVILETQQGTKLSEMNRIALAVEEKLRAMPEVKTVFASVGTSSDSWIGGDAAGNTAELNVSLIAKEDRTRPATQIGEDIKGVVENFAGVKVRIAPIGIFGSADDAPIILTMRGANRDSVLIAAERLADVIRRTAGTDGVRLSLQTGKPESRAQLDHKRMAAYGLRADAVGEALRVAYTGDDEMKLTSFTQGGDVKLRIRLGESDRARASDLERLKFTTPTGDQVGLNQFASFVSAETYSKLERRNRQNSVTVYAQVLGRATGDVGAEILEKMNGIQLPQGVKLLTEGDLEYQSDAFGKLLLAFVAAVLFVYLIMVALYNSWVYPFVVLFSIPVAIVGALVALAITGHTLNIFSLLGVIMLIGLVAKNAILIVDHTNQLRAQGSSIDEALITAGRTRLRPILMTTIAMAVGMLPIAMADGAGAEWKNGLAWVLIGGLTSSLLLTLILVPTVYIDIERLRTWSLDIIKVLAGKFSRTPHTSKPSHEKSEGSLSRPATLTILLLTLASPLYAQPQAKSLSIREAIVLGLERNIDVQIAALGVRKSGEQIREATSAVLPVVTASGQYVRNVRQPVFFFPNIALDESSGKFVFGALQPVPAGASNVYSGAVSASLPLFEWSAYSGIRAAQVAGKMSEASTMNAKQNAVADIKKMYLNVLVLQAQHLLAVQSLARAEQSLVDSRGLLRQGLASDADTLRTFVAAETQRPALFKLENDIEAALANLKMLIGIDEKIVLTDSLVFAPQTPQTLAFLTSQALNRSTLLEQLALQQQAAETQIESEAAAHLPSLSAIGQVQVQAQSDDFKFSNYDWPVSVYAGLQLSVPIFSGFKTDAKVQQAAIAREQAAKELNYARRKVEVSVRVAMASLAEAEQRLRAQAQTVAAAERSYAATKSRWLKGLSRQSDLADAELSLAQAKANALQAIYDCRIAEIDLDRVAGKFVQSN